MIAENIKVFYWDIWYIEKYLLVDAYVEIPLKNGVLLMGCQELKNLRLGVVLFQDVAMDEYDIKIIQSVELKYVIDGNLLKTSTLICDLDQVIYIL